MRKAVAFSLIAIAVGCLGALLLAEVALRIAGIGYGNAPLVSDPILHHVHPRNYRFLSHDPAGEYGGFPIYYDDLGLVADPEGRMVYEPDRHDRPVALMGDSFVEAGQVPFRDSFAGVLNQNAREDVFFRNFGVSSYSPLLHSLQWDGTVTASRPPAHVFLLLFSNDPDNDSSYLKQAVTTSEGVVTAVPGPSDRWLRRYLRKSYVVRLIRKAQLTAVWLYQHRQTPRTTQAQVIEESTELGDLTAEYVRKVQAKAHAAGAQFTLLAVPSKAEAYPVKGSERARSFSENVGEWAARNDTEYLDLNPAFRAYYDNYRPGQPPTFFRRDIHLTEAGHRIVAQEIMRRYPDYFKRRRD